MKSAKVDQIGQAAVNAAISEAGDEARDMLVIVVVRPLRAGERLGVTCNLAGGGNHPAVAAVLGDARAAVACGGSKLVEPTRRILIPS